MIISVSRRTDIPHYYSDWFWNRLQAGYALVRNPMNPRQVSKILLDPSVVDAFVFWSKNPEPMVEKLSGLLPYPYYFQFTLNPYGTEIEPGLPARSRRVDTLKRLSDQIGPHRVVWRYDPIFISDTYPVSWHKDAFLALSQALTGSVDHCVISFLDEYPKIKGRTAPHAMRPPSPAEVLSLAADFSAIATTNHLTLATCAEAVDLTEYGIETGSCIDRTLLTHILGAPLRLKVDTGQRPHCHCVESIDIGAYESCCTHCVYCYALRGHPPAVLHCPHSPLLIGEPTEEDRITTRPMRSLLLPQQLHFGMDC